MKGEDAAYEEWVNKVPKEIVNDSLWKMKAYRLALFATDLGWQDVTRLQGDHRAIGVSDQLYRALGKDQRQSGGRIFSQHRQGSGSLLWVCVGIGA